MRSATRCRAARASRFVRSLATAGVAAGVALGPAEARAQGYDSQIRIDQLQPATAFSPFTRAEGPHQQFDEGIEFAFRLAGDYALNPLTATVVGVDSGTEFEEVSPVAHALLLHLDAALSPLYWLTFDFNFPLAVYETGESSTSVVQEQIAAGEMGHGDGRIGALLHAVTSESFGFSLGARVWAPWGSDAAYLKSRDGHMRMELVLAATGEYDSFLWGCTAGVAPLLFAGHDGDRAALSCAGHFAATPSFSFGLEPHVALFTYAAADKRDSYAPGFGAAANPGQAGSALAVGFEPLAAARFHLAGFQVGAAAGPGLGGAPGTPTFRGVLTIGYSALGEPVVEERGPQDSDLDGLPDDYDKCPKEAGTEELQGCPEEQDQDGDGIVDGDACPEEPGARYDDPTANGCPDRDNDSLADPVDRCPVEPGPKPEGCPQHARLAGLDRPGHVRFRIKPPIEFEKQSARLPSVAVDTLREIVATMRANPQLEQVSITVGARRASPKLTDQRAKAILLIFSQDQDFDSRRYEVVIGDDLGSGKVSVRIIQ